MTKPPNDTSGNAPETAIGISWYRPETFDLCLAAFDDAIEMQDTYEEWLSDAERLEADAKERGLPVLRIYIDPVEFPKWCRREGFAQISSQARSIYVSREVERIWKRRQRKNK